MEVVLSPIIHHSFEVILAGGYKVNIICILHLCDQRVGVGCKVGSKEIFEIFSKQ